MPLAIDAIDAAPGAFGLLLTDLFYVTGPRPGTITDRARPGGLRAQGAARNDCEWILHIEVNMLPKPYSTDFSGTIIPKCYPRGAA